ncbi:MAG: InlB B-repeat-containing protein [Micrococcales bacterium]
MKISNKVNALVAVAALVVATFAGAAATSAAPKPVGNSVTWSGQGTSVVNGDRVLSTVNCDANNTPYLAFVLSGTKATSAWISLDGGRYMTKANVDKKGYSTFKYNYAPGSNINLNALMFNVSATYNDALNKPSFVVSHGCVGNTAVVNYTLTSSAGANGSISPLGVTTLPQGSSQTFTITPDTGYEVSTLTVDGSPVTPSTSYTFSNLTASHTIAATFALAVVRHTITASAGSNGTITPSGATTVVDGTDKTFTFTPSTGYSVATLKIDGVSVSVANSYTFTNVTADHTIEVTFAAPTFMLYASGGWDEGNPNYAYSATCDGVNSPNVTISNGCSKVQVVIHYDDTTVSRPGGYPLVSGRDRWAYVYASPGLNCTETQQLTTLPYSSTFDCDVTGTTTYFVVMGVASSEPNQSVWPVGTAFVYGYNYVSFGSITGTYSGNDLTSWSPGTNAGPGYTACLVVNNVATSTCFTVSNGEFWMDSSDAAYMQNANNTWEITMTGGTAGDQYNFWNRGSLGTKIGPLTNTNTVRVSTFGDTIVFGLYENIS